MKKAPLICPGPTTFIFILSPTLPYVYRPLYAFYSCFCRHSFPVSVLECSSLPWMYVSPVLSSFPTLLLAVADFTCSQRLYTWDLDCLSILLLAVFVLWTTEPFATMQDCYCIRLLTKRSLLLAVSNCSYTRDTNVWTFATIFALTKLTRPDPSIC